MNIRGAIDDTMALAMRAVSGDPTNVPNLANFSSPDIGYVHACEMYDKIMVAEREGHPMSRGKLNRWLAWIQCSVVSWGITTLEEMKDINRRRADDYVHGE